METIDISTKALEYASGKAVASLTNAIEQAYKDGYLEGFKDGKERADAQICSGDVNYVDLGLPSGTLWADDYVLEDGKLLYCAYGEAEHMSLPTQKQWDELQRNCVWKYGFDGDSKFAKCIGLNGRMIRFRERGKYEGDKMRQEGSLFWILSEKSSSPGENNRWCAKISFERGQANQNSVPCFVGFELPVRLVKTRE